MKNFKKIIMLSLIVFTCIFSLTACNDNEDKTNVGSGYKDVIERPDDIPPLADLEYVKYPEKPENLSAGQGSGMPLVGTAESDSEYYRITQEEGKITIKYNEVERWNYIYLPLSNFNAEYQNIKITATATNVQKISITALYCEMYDSGNPAVTTLISDVGDTEQFYIMELGKTKLLDQSYYTLDDNLGTQTVFALCIFLDSNPSQSVTNKNTDIESVFEISNIEFLKDGDEALKDRYVDPSFNVGYCDGNYTLEKDIETNAYTINKSAGSLRYESATIAVSNFSSEYTTLKFKYTTTNVTRFTVELTFTGGQAGWSNAVTVHDSMLSSDGEYEATIDFSAVQPVDMTTWMAVPGYYIKNYKINGIKFYLDTAYDTDEQLIAEDASCVISEIAFERVVVEGTTISKGWNTMSSNITIGSDLAVGGIGTIEYNWYETWDYLAIPVVNYQKAEKLVVEFQASEELGYIGIGLGCAAFTQGEAIIKSCHDDILTEAEKSGDVEGVVETIEYDAVNCIYKITFDFTNAASIAKYNNRPVNEMPINSLRFYFTVPYAEDMFEGTRSVRFISIAFI